MRITVRLPSLAVCRCAWFTTTEGSPLAGQSQGSGSNHPIRQGADIQHTFYGTGQSLPVRTRCVYTGIWLGRGRVSQSMLCAAAAGLACKPIRGARSEGQVENQVGNIREWLFTPKACFTSLADLNDWLAQRCRELACRKHPADTTRSIADVFAEEQRALRAITAPFDGYIEEMVRVSNTSLIRVDHNRYSVPAAFAGKAVSVRLSAEHVRIVFDREIIAAHPRRFGREHLICDPWHYLPLLEKKAGALRNGIPFTQWPLPDAIVQVRDRMLKQAKGDRAFVELLLMAREVGLEPLQVACELALESGVVTGSVVMNELRRLIAPSRPDALSLPDSLRLQVEPQADCARYDALRGGAYVLH